MVSVQGRRLLRTGPERGLQALRDGARRVPGSVARRLRGHLPQPAAAPAPARRPLLSVVVPVYAVERYLAECLDSVLEQTLEDLEVVMVDDGSPDGSTAIAQAYVERYPRFRLVRQANAGLSAARNAGAVVATGRYLTFLDSDDRLARDAYALLVGSLERSGSDFSVGCYRRFDSRSSWAAAPWIRQAHERTRTGVSIAEHPAALVNAVAWTKVYRRSFYDGQGLRFPPGVLYEDQAVSAAAYARARAFDVLAQATHAWRVREDTSSISQQVTDPADLRARFAAASDSLAVLAAEAGPEVELARRVQLLSNDFPLSIAQVPRAGAEFWDVLSAELPALADPLDEQAWSQVPAAARAMVHLVRHGLHAELLDFLGADGRDLASQRTRAADGVVVAELPLSDAVPAAERARLGVLAPSQTRLVTSLRRVRWHGEDRLEISAWAHVDHVDLSGLQPVTTVRLHDQRSGAVLELPVTTVHDPDLMRLSRAAHLDLRPAAFHVTVDAAALLADDAKAADWRVEVEVEVAGLTRTGLLRAVDTAGSAGAVRAQLQGSGVRVQPVHDPEDGLVLQARRPPVVAEALAVHGRTLTCELVTRGGAVPQALLARHATTGEVRSGELVARGERAWTARLDLGPAPAQAGPEGADGNHSWSLRLVDARGRERPVAWPASWPVDRVLSVGDPRLTAVRTRAANVALADLADLVLVRSVAAHPDGLEVEVQVLGERAGPPSFSLRSARLGVEPSVVEQRGELLRLVFPLEADEWGLGGAPLPVADHVLVATRTGDDGAPVQVVTELDAAAVAQLPLPVDACRLRARVQRQAPGALRLRVDRPLADDERGAYFQRRLQDDYRTSTARPEQAVLFRTYYGESATDSALAVHDELRRRGAPVTAYWAVRDHSVHVPEGGVPVLHDSARWYEVLRDATWVVDNMHQPAYFTKREHQVVVATMHGYPFKEMGHPHWERLGFSPARVRSFDERAAQWDHLLSPATYATPLLRRDFRYGGPVLEIGYPRNDLLLGPEAGRVREQTRERLGLAPTAQVVLYAPTFRDALSANDHSAPMVDFLDGERLVTGLGEDAVLLVRGHAFNARTSARTERQGRVLDVTDYPQVNDLLLAADALVADYSSLRFDFALTGKPMVFLVPDLEDYRAGRGWLFDFEASAPGPQVATTDEVVEALRDPEGLARRCAEAYARFRTQFLDLEDGAAAGRFVDAVFGPRGGSDRG